MQTDKERSQESFSLVCQWYLTANPGENTYYNLMKIWMRISGKYRWAAVAGRWCMCQPRRGFTGRNASCQTPTKVRLQRKYKYKYKYKCNKTQIQIHSLKQMLPARHPPRYNCFEFKYKSNREQKYLHPPMHTNAPAFATTKIQIEILMKSWEVMPFLLPTDWSFQKVWIVNI